MPEVAVPPKPFQLKSLYYYLNKVVFNRKLPEGVSLDVVSGNKSGRLLIRLKNPDQFRPIWHYTLYIPNTFANAEEVASLLLPQMALINQFIKSQNTNDEAIYNDMLKRGPMYQKELRRINAREIAKVDTNPVKIAVYDFDKLDK